MRAGIGPGAGESVPRANRKADCSRAAERADFLPRVSEFIFCFRAAREGLDITAVAPPVHVRESPPSDADNDQEESNGWCRAGPFVSSRYSLRSAHRLRRSRAGRL